MNKRECRQLNGLDYDKALEILAGKKTKKLCANTYLTLGFNRDIELVYHNTAIIIFCVNDEIVLNNGGWYTSTTKERMNMFLPNNVRVWQDKGQWQVRDKTDYYPYANGQVFKNGTLIRE